MFIFTKSFPFYPLDYVPHAWWRFTVSYEMKTNVSVASVEGAQGFILGFIFVFSRANGKLQRPIWAKKEHLLFVHGQIHWRGMNKEGSKVKVGINYGKSFLKVSPKTMVNYYNDFKLHQSSKSGSAFKFSGTKRMRLQVPETHINCQEIVYLAKDQRDFGLHIHRRFGDA